MSLRVVAAPIGAVVGFAIGGPAGAAWGWQIGATAGAILDPQTIKGPSLGDIAAQTSQEGGPIPIVYGISSPIAGNIISCSPPRIETVKSGGKGGPKVETEVVYRTYAIGICEGPIGGVLRVWRNNTKVYDALDPEFTAPQSDVSEIPGWAGGGEVAAEVPSRNAAFLEKARFFLGAYDQNASPDLEAIHGAGTTPAYRGLAYMVMADEDVTDVGGMVPQWLFQISRAGLPAKKRDVFIPLGISAPSWNQTWVKPAGVDAVDVLIVGTGGPSRSVAQTALDSSAAGGGGGGQVRWVENVSVTEDVTVIVPDPTLGQQATATLLVSFGSLTAQTGGGWSATLYPEKADGASGAGGAVNRSGSNNIVYPPGVSTIGQGAGGVAVVTGNGVNDDAYGGGGGGAGGNGQDAVIGKGGDGGVGVYMGHLVGDDLGDDGWFGGGGGGGHGHDIPGAVAGAGGKGGGGQGANGYDGPASPGMPGTGGGAGGVSGTDPPDAEARGGGGIVVVLYDDPNPPTPPLQQLPSVVSSLCERAGLSPDEIDVSLLDTEVIVHGITVTNQYAASQAIQSLGQVYRFDATKYDGKIRFVPRGGNSVATITEDEMVDESDAPIDANTKRSDAIAIPRVLNLSYYDIDSSGLTPIKQTSERSGDRRAVGDASMQSAVVMDADTAGQAVHIAHAVMLEEQKGELRFALPDSHIKLVPSDPVIVQWQGKSERCRLNQVEILDGYQRYVALRDRQSSYTSDVEGLPPPVIPTPPSRVPGPTVVIPLDIPIVQDADDSVGLSYYVAVCGLTGGWTGAVVELSYDGGANYTQSRSATIPAIIGKLKTELPDHPADYPDGTNAFTVELFSPNGELADTDLAGMMNRINLAAVGNFEDGWELINFADATEDDPELRHWTISSLLRGRRGTATRAHAVDDVFVLLDRGVVAMESASVTDIGKTLTFRATSNGATTDTGTVVSVDYSGWSQKERTPAYLEAQRDGDDLHISFQGVGRLGGGASATHGLYFTGYRVEVDDKINPAIVTNTLDQSLTVDASGLLEPVEVRVAQVNSLTGIGPYATTGWPVLNLQYAYDAVGRDGSDEAWQRPMRIGDSLFVMARRYHTMDSSSDAMVVELSADGKSYITSHSITSAAVAWDAVTVAGYIYIAYTKIADNNKIIKMDPADGSILEETSVGGDFYGVQTDGTNLFAFADNNMVYKLDPDDLGEVATPIALTSSVSEMTYGGGRLFVLYNEILPTRASVAVIDPVSFAVVDTFEVPEVDVSCKMQATDRCLFMRTGNSLSKLVVYRHDGTVVASYDTDVFPNGVAVAQQWFATDGDFVCTTVDQKIKFYDGRSGQHIEGQDIEMQGPVGGYVDGHFVIFNGENASDGKFFKRV